MSIENDIIKIRQILAELQKKGNFYVTYNEADLTAKPSNPTGDGDTGDDAIAGWSTTATEDSNWMSTKRSGNINTGTWSDPIAIRGVDGEDGATGATGAAGADGSDFGPLSDDIPEMTGIRFAIASGNLAWTGGTIEYGGSTYTLTADPTGLNNDYVYFDATDSTPGGAAVFRGTDTLSIAIDITGSGHWCMCKRESGNAYPAAPFKVIQAEAMMVASLSAIAADLGTITAGSMTLSGLSGSATTEALAQYQLKITAGGVQGRWRGSALPAWSDTESGSGTSYNSGWRDIVDITGNEVRISFDSYDSGDSLDVQGKSFYFGGTVYSSGTRATSSSSDNYVYSDAFEIETDGSIISGYNKVRYPNASSGVEATSIVDIGKYDGSGDTDDWANYTSVKTDTMSKIVTPTDPSWYGQFFYYNSTTAGDLYMIRHNVKRTAGTTSTINGSADVSVQVPIDINIEKT